VIRCQVEGLSRPLRLTVSGTCVGAPASRDVYHVTTSVRQLEIKSLPVSNQTAGVTYNLRPVIDGTDHFSGPETLTVPPSSTRNYELTYQPLTMTTDGRKHTVQCHTCLVCCLLFICWSQFSLLFPVGFLSEQVQWGNSTSFTWKTTKKREN